MCEIHQERMGKRSKTLFLFITKFIKFPCSCLERNAFVYICVSKNC